MMNASIPSARPSVVRVERSFRNSERRRSITGAPSRPSARGRRPPASSPPVTARAGRCRGGRGLADLFARGAAHGSVLPARSISTPSRASAWASCSACGERTRTPPETWAVSSASDPSVTSRPRLMIRTRSTTCATSARTWLETKNGLPLRGEPPQELAQPANALRIEPVRGLVEDQELRVAEERGGEAETLAHAERIGLHAALRGARRARRARAPRRRATTAARPRRPASADGCGRSPGMKVGRFEHGADAQRGAVDLRVPLSEHLRRAGRRRRQAEQHAQGRRLARAVRAEEAGDRAGLEPEGKVVDGAQLPELLREPLGDDNR